MASEEIQLEIVAKFGEAIKELKKFSGSAEDAFKSFEKGVQKNNSTFSIFTANLAANIATKGIEAVGNAIAGVSQFLSESIKASAEQEAAINSLNQAMAASGQFTVQAS